MTYEDKVWAKRAAALRLNEVEGVQASAEKWRNGLVALTALLTAVTIVKGPEKFSELSGTGRGVVSALLASALTVLLAGSAAAMRAAFGFPSNAELMSSSTLKQWASGEAQTATNLLRGAVVSFFVAIPLIFTATATTWFDSSWFGEDERPRVLIVVEREDGVEPAKPCGALAGLSRTEIEVERVEGDPLPGNLVIPLGSVRATTVVAKCPSS